jgi:hypothetical protein
MGVVYLALSGAFGFASINAVTAPRTRSWSRRGSTSPRPARRQWRRPTDSGSPSCRSPAPSACGGWSRTADITLTDRELAMLDPLAAQVVGARY